MFKRLPLYNRGKENQISNPILIETTYDDEALEKIPNVSELQSPTSNFHPQPTAPQNNTNDVLTALPALPFRSMLPPHQASTNRVSDVPTASSIYSQPTPETTYGWPQSVAAMTPPSHCPDISPPSSAGGSDERRSSFDHFGHEISPVESSTSEPSDDKGLHSDHTSQIPVLRKLHGRLPNADSQESTKIDGEQQQDVAPSVTRWDEYSGERTTSSSGKPAQVKPGSYTYMPSSTAANGRQPAHHTPLGGEGEKPKQSTLKERASRFASKKLSIETKPRQPWKGASGRSAIMSPLTDNLSPATQPLAVPPRGQRRPSPSGGPGEITPSSTPPKVQPSVETFPVSVDHERSEVSDAPIKPIVPLKVGKNSPAHIAASPATAGFQTTAYPSPISLRNVTPTSVQAGVGKATALPSSTEEANRKAVRRKSIDSVASTQTVRRHGDEHPTSRFSWTTYATDTTYQSPPPSPPPPMPSVPEYPSGLSTPTPILSRRRPVPSIASTTASSTARKPVPTHHSPSSTTTRTTTTASTATKALPLSPPELASVDLVTSLQAQLDALALRRGNIQRVMRDLTQPRAQNPLVSDLAARRRAEQKAKVLEAELAEVTSLEHEVGLRLHRAWKRREGNGETSTTLWVRRVTG